MLAENLADNISSPTPKALPSVPQEGAIVADGVEVIRPEQVVVSPISTPAKSPVDDRPEAGDEDFDMDKEMEEVRSCLINRSRASFIASLRPLWPP